MARCRAIRPLLPVYADGDLSERERHVVQDHLRACAGCREALERMSQTLALIGRRAVKQPASELVQDVTRRVEERLREPRQVLKQVPWHLPAVLAMRPALVIAAVLVFVVGAAVWRTVGIRGMSEEQLREELALLEAVGEDLEVLPEEVRDEAMIEELRFLDELLLAGAGPSEILEGTEGELEDLLLMLQFLGEETGVEMDDEGFMEELEELEALQDAVG